ncbi:hypothetical protein Tco_0061555 [Tanacetum coccineum]
MLVQSTSIIFWLAEHFGLLIEERLQGLTAWVALGLERKQVAAAGTSEVAEGALDVDEGDQDISAHIQTPQPLPASGPARTMAHSLGRLEEDVYYLRGALGEQ